METDGFTSLAVVMLVCVEILGSVIDLARELLGNEIIPEVPSRVAIWLLVLLVKPLVV